MGIDAEMYVVTDDDLTDEQIVAVSHALGTAFGADKFMRTEQSDKWCRAHHNLSRVEKIEQDGPDWHTPKGKYLYRVHLWTGYYGVGYERGDLPFLIVLAEWLEARFPGCQIMYGGDSSGVLVEPWGPKERRALLRHFASDHGRDYFSRFGAGMGFSREIPTCDFCAGRPLDQLMWGWGAGNKVGGFRCSGCGRRVLRRGDGSFVRLDDHGDDWKEAAAS